ncbi:TetR/AcrR family transcriptional regulator [Streptomyces sp. A1-5]|uniref:TetR/AcrR family transcriptional regulator n=1 Tax=Streptomyces sp. A1-5 TaxID=2738410 RepID=UPI001F3044B6|nr:helix-turn-helix domain-containing protein [Streptomyces sp. A1-5]UJB46219.1 TetR/AcrR family transcriptional regulator [Streptomyces sp. A1-5]
MNTKRRGRPPLLSRESIVAAARQIADTQGMEALTVRRVAQALGGGQASLYRHISDRGELLLLLAQDVAVHLPVDERAGDSPQRMVAYWSTAHDYLARHPWAARIIADGEYVLDEAAPFAASAMRGLEALGLERSEGARAYRAMWNMMLGYLLNAHPVGHTVGHGHPGPQGAGELHGQEVDRGADFAWALERLLHGMLR